MLADTGGGGGSKPDKKHGSKPPANPFAYVPPTPAVPAWASGAPSSSAPRSFNDLTAPSPKPSLPEILPPTTTADNVKLPSQYIYGGNGMMQNPAYADARKELEAAQAADASALELYRESLHERAMGSDIQGPHQTGHGIGVPEVKPMTWEQYNALSDEQRAAVDFNTMLVRAVHKDLRLQDKYDPNKRQQKEYDTQVESIFGEDGGSDTYAPETLGVLKQIDFSNHEADLDEFINLQAAITAKDIRRDLTEHPPLLAVEDRTTKPWEAPATDPAQIRTDIVSQLATQTQKMQEALVKGNVLLQSVNATAAVGRNSFLAAVGGKINDPQTLPGYGDPQLDANGQPANIDAYFQQAFRLLAEKDGEADRDQILANMNEVLSPQEFQQFQTYADMRSTNADRYNIPLVDGDGQYRSPEQFRKLLGLD